MHITESLSRQLTSIVLFHMNFFSIANNNENIRLLFVEIDIQITEDRR